MNGCAPSSKTSRFRSIATRRPPITKRRYTLRQLRSYARSERHVRCSGTESSRTLRWRRQSRANPSLKQAHVGGQLTRGARGYKNKLGNNPMRRPTEGNVRVAQERAMDV